MPRGRKKSHKGGHRHFTNEDDIQQEAEKLKKEHEWRKMKGIESDEEEVEGEDKKTEDGAKAAPVKKPPKEKPELTGEPGELPPSDSEEGSEDEEDDEPDKPKGVSHLIEIENPNRLKAKTKKVTDIAVEEGAQGPSLSRREREELEKQAAKDRYDKMHAAGKTDEARADLARLALIRKQREDAAKKREDERKAQEDAKTAAEKKLMEKKKAAS